MGITGLLPLLKPVTKDTHVRELKGLVSVKKDRLFCSYLAMYAPAGAELQRRCGFVMGAHSQVACLSVRELLMFGRI